MMTNTEIKTAAFENGRNPRRWEERHYLYHKGFLETRGVQLYPHVHGKRLL